MAQTCPHPPQLLGSLLGLTQAPLQMISLAGQLHTPLWQLAPVGHTWPHMPQLLGSLDVLVQALPQTTCLAGQVQAPL